MIFRLTNKYDEVEFAQAKDQLHLLKSYIDEYGCEDFMEIVKIEEISSEDAKNIMLQNLDYDEDDPDDIPSFSLYDTVVGEDFLIVSSTKWS